jgi:magnesium-protoporphyrin O-methyltransferase
MSDATYTARRSELRTYFDQTAVEAWARLTSNEPVSGIRATVRAGRDRMRATLLSWLPADLTGRRILDAGCGSGALAQDLARRGAHVVAIDLSEKLVTLAAERLSPDLGQGRIEFRVGDMTDDALGRFDHVVAMDSLIHYRADDLVRSLVRLAARTHTSLLFTHAPRTPALTAMHAIGRLFPRSDRAPAIEPISGANLRRRLAEETRALGMAPDRDHRIVSGFYVSQAMELTRT